MVNDDEKKSQVRLSKRAKAYQAVFSTDDGKFVLRDLMRRYRFFGQTAVCGDLIASNFLDGQRSVVIDIFNTLETNLEEKIKLLASLPKQNPYE